MLWFMLIPMKQVLVELEDELAARLEPVAPGRSRKRSEFIRSAIKQALSVLEEEKTRKAYERSPDDPSEYAFDAETWDPWEPSGGAGAVSEA